MIAFAGGSDDAKPAGNHLDACGGAEDDAGNCEEEEDSTVALNETAEVDTVTATEDVDDAGGEDESKEDKSEDATLDDPADELDIAVAATGLLGRESRRLFCLEKKKKKKIVRLGDFFSSF